MFILMTFVLGIQLYYVIVEHKLDSYRIGLMPLYIFNVANWSIVWFKAYRKKNKVIRETEWYKLYL